MDSLLDTLEVIFFTDIIGEFDLYTILATALKYIFVIIVMRYIYLIIKMIYLDLRGETGIAEANAYLRLLSRREDLGYPIREIYPLDESITVGRDPDNKICIQDPFLSKEHAEIYPQNGRYYLKDLGSANGTYLNRERITGPVEVHDKDIITFGPLHFIFMEEEE